MSLEAELAGTLMQLREFHYFIIIKMIVLARHDSANRSENA